MSLASRSGPSSPVRSQKTGTGTADTPFYFNALLRAPLEVASFPAPRSLQDVRRQIAEEIAAKLTVTAQDVDGTRVGVRLITSKDNDEEYLRLIVSKIEEIRHRHLFAVGIEITPALGGDESTLIITGSTDDLINRAMLLIKSKFMSRLKKDMFVGDMWIASIVDLGLFPHDKDAILDALRKASRTPVDPLKPPPGSRGIDEILLEVRAKLTRVTARQAYDELLEPQVDAPTFLVDLRPKDQREMEGDIPGAVVMDRNSLEWKFDPRSPTRLDIVNRYDLRIILLCQDGTASSLAAHSLLQLGLLNVTDVIGGFQEWIKGGFPISLNTRQTAAVQTRTPARLSPDSSQMLSQLEAFGLV
ncbi:hypothetical protein CPC08DRAFT_628797 [Agrocybe pediades]|nr:hypothetical protein CPC08DRAFT_628797 [Agrocybe pediades]